MAYWSSKRKIILFLWKVIIKRFSYCKLHLLYAYQPKGKKEDVVEKDDVPEFIEKSNQLK